MVRRNVNLKENRFFGHSITVADVLARLNNSYMIEVWSNELLFDGLDVELDDELANAEIDTIDIDGSYKNNPKLIFNIY